MADWKEALFELGVHVVAFVVMILLGIVAFFVTTFVVVTGAGLADVSAGGDFVVLASALLVAAAILGGRSPAVRQAVPSMEPGGDEDAGPEIA